MKLCIDDANVERIRHIYAYFPVDGVSTNPSILAKTGRTPYEVLKEIRSIIGEEGAVDAAPALIANHGDAALIHEAAIGKIAGEQLLKLRTLGLTEEEAEARIVAGFLK